MKIKHKKQYHHGDLRNALLVAAERELEESGIEAFSLRKVAKRAGVSHAAPAHHFKDVSGLLTALAVVGKQRCLKFMKEAEQTSTDTEDALLCTGLGYIEFAATHNSLFRLVFGSNRPNQDDPELSLATSLTFKHLTDHVERLTGRHPLTDASAVIDAYAIWATAHGIADLLSSGRLLSLKALNDLERADAIKSILRRSLRDASH